MKVSISIEPGGFAGDFYTIKMVHRSPKYKYAQAEVVPEEIVFDGYLPFVLTEMKHKLREQVNAHQKETREKRADEG